MKRTIYSFAIFALILTGVFTAPTTTGAAGKERARVQFTETVKLRDVLLRGDYLVVHDDSAMAKGNPCLSIYRGDSESPEKLVVAYHCRHVVRNRTDSFLIRTSRARSFELPEVTEIQFAGTIDGHQVP
jgi:hypothetical protein